MGWELSRDTRRIGYYHVNEQKQNITYLVNKHPTKTESDGKDGVLGQSQNCNALLMKNSADYAKQSRT